MLLLCKVLVLNNKKKLHSIINLSLGGNGCIHSPRYVRIPREARGSEADRRAAGLRGPRGGRPADAGAGAAARRRRAVRRGGQGAPRCADRVTAAV